MSTVFVPVLPGFTAMPRLAQFFDSLESKAHKIDVQRPDQVWFGNVTYLKARIIGVNSPSRTSCSACFTSAYIRSASDATNASTVTPFERRLIVALAAPSTGLKVDPSINLSHGHPRLRTESASAHTSEHYPLSRK